MFDVVNRLGVQKSELALVLDFCEESPASLLKGGFLISLQRDLPTTLAPWHPECEDGGKQKTLDLLRFYDESRVPSEEELNDNILVVFRTVTGGKMIGSAGSRSDGIEKFSAQAMKMLCEGKSDGESKSSASPSDKDKGEEQSCGDIKMLSRAVETGLLSSEQKQEVSHCA